MKRYEQLVFSRFGKDGEYLHEPCWQRREMLGCGGVADDFMFPKYPSVLTTDVVLLVIGGPDQVLLVNMSDMINPEGSVMPTEQRKILIEKLLKEEKEGVFVFVETRDLKLTGSKFESKILENKDVIQKSLEAAGCTTKERVVPNRSARVVVKGGSSLVWLYDRSFSKID